MAEPNPVQQEGPSGAVPAPGLKRSLTDALTLAPRKKRRTEEDYNPYIHHGRHFGRTVFAMANIGALITNGIARHSGPCQDIPESELTARERREMAVFQSLRRLGPEIDEVLFNGTVADILSMGKLLQKGADAARYDDTKSLKSAVVDWIQPVNGPPIKIHRAQKTDRGFLNDLTGALLCPAHLDWDDEETRSDLRDARILPAADEWPRFLYANNYFDPEDPWLGFLRSELLIKGFRHVFTSPTSAEGKHQATRSGNARIHGWTKVTSASIIYIATQIRFALMPVTAFVRTDLVTGSEKFYTILTAFLDDPDEAEDVAKLLEWWNSRIFPNENALPQSKSKDSALAKFVEHRDKKKREALATVSNSQ